MLFRPCSISRRLLALRASVRRNRPRRSRNPPKRLMRPPPELRRNPLAFRDSGGRQAEQGEEVKSSYRKYPTAESLVSGPITHEFRAPLEIAGEEQEPMPAAAVTVRHRCFGPPPVMDFDGCMYASSIQYPPPRRNRSIVESCAFAEKAALAWPPITRLWRIREDPGGKKQAGGEAPLERVINPRQHLRARRAGRASLRTWPMTPATFVWMNRLSETGQGSCLSVSTVTRVASITPLSSMSTVFPSAANWVMVNVPLYLSPS